MIVTVSIGPDDSDRLVTCSVEDEERFTPEVVDDMLKRASRSALSTYRELHPAPQP